MSHAGSELDRAGNPSRFVVGIDLGTTNSAVAYVDTASNDPRVHNFLVPQLVAAGQVEARETLPSFFYRPAEGEFSDQALRLPWNGKQPANGPIVGFFARDHGELAPGRLIASAKSWLCHAGVDRSAELLPWHGAADVPRRSPVEVSGQYLAHIRAAWNHRFPEHPLECQDVVLTLPASFDEVARELTVKAAHLANLPRVVLVEEPQAAFYAWIDKHRLDWERLVQPGQKILVCDIGGGTTDFTLIRVRAGKEGKALFHRVAVGEHLILGGDNLDLALAHHVERRLMGPDGKLSPRQWSVLVQTARRVKETLLGPSPPEHLTISLPGSGTRLIGSSLQLELDRGDVQQLLVEGFLPDVKLTDKPSARRSGFQEFGLPYASDAAITRYLAAFLSTHRHAGDAPDERQTANDPARPDIVLFNGGFFASPQLRDKLLAVLQRWFSGDDPQRAWQPIVLDHERLDLAVARGAAYYGLVRRGIGVRISAGLARSYYIGIETAENPAPQAICLVPAGVEEGQSVELTERRFDLLIRQPVEFPLYVSSTRLTDPAAAIVPVDLEQMSPLPPIRTVLQAGKKSAPAESLSVTLHARLTEIGTIELWCSEVGGKRTWRLQFDVRAATQTDLRAHEGAGERAGMVDQDLVTGCCQLVRDTFAPLNLAAKPSPESLMKRLELTAESRRNAWPPSLLRSLWDVLLETESGRRLSPEHEARWLYLLGFALRPGHGMALDDWRVAQSWRLLQGKLVHQAPMCRVEWLILWRRIAAGLTAGQQRALAEPLLATLPTLLSGGSRKSGGSGGHEVAEALRLLGACELLPVETKVALGNNLVLRLAKEKSQAMQEAALWTIARLGARVPFHGPLNGVVPADAAVAWNESLMALRERPPSMAFAIMQLARRTDDRYRDLPPSSHKAAIDWLTAQRARPHWIQLVREVSELEEEEQNLVFGESLPRGLRLE